MKKTGRYRGRMTEKGKVGKTRRIPQKLLPVHHPLPSTRPSESTPAGSRAAEQQQLTSRGTLPTPAVRSVSTKGAIVATSTSQLYVKLNQRKSY